MPTISEYKPHRHTIRGRKGDGVPATEVVFRFVFDGATVVKESWSAIAQVRASSSGAVVHAFDMTLQDSGDDSEILSNELEVRLTPLTSAQSSLLDSGTYPGDLQITKTGEQPLTVVVLSLQILDDYAR